jgi:replicative DNA helicase
MTPVSPSGQAPIYAEESEQAILGCILLSPRECLPAVVSAFGDTSEAFHDIRHKAIYESMMAMDDDGAPIDLITLQQFLKDLGQLASSGGRGYLSELPDKVASVSMIGSYIATVQDKWKLRRMNSALWAGLQSIAESGVTAAEVIDKIEGSIIQAGKVGASSATTWSGGKQLAGLALDQFQQIFSANGKPTGISTGFPDLDKVTLGLHKTQYFCIAARPSYGKTSLAMNIAEHVAVNLRVPVGVFSLETSTDLLAARMLSSMAQVDMRSTLLNEDMPKLAMQASRLGGAPIFINESSMDMASIRSEARRLKTEHGIGLMVLDYLQLASSSEGRDRREKVEAVSRGMKLLAKELDIPVIVLAQLSREVAKQDREPQLEDLRECGGIEQDADVVLMLHRRFGPTDDRDDWVNPFKVDAIIRKQKQGPRNVIVPLTFHPRHTRFTSHTGEHL